MFDRCISEKIYLPNKTGIFTFVTTDIGKIVNINTNVVVYSQDKHFNNVMIWKETDKMATVLKSQNAPYKTCDYVPIPNLKEHFVYSITNIV